MKKNKGFTLIELLVVIAIIALLSTLAVVALSSARAKARDAKRIADIKQVQSALELYFNDKNSYPVGDFTLGSATADVLCDTDAGLQADATGCTTTYMGQVPPNPTPNGAPYAYSGTTSSYTIVLNLEGATGGLTAGTHTASPAGVQ